MDFSRAEALLMASRVRATSMSFFFGVIRLKLGVWSLHTRGKAGGVSNEVAIGEPTSYCS
jgi:hypothetical protein